MEEGYLVSATDLKRLETMLQAYERGELGPVRTKPPRSQAAGRPDIVVILLDSVNSGQEVQAAVLEDVTTNETQTITAYGQPTGGYFRLGFKPDPTATVEWTAHIDPLKDDAETIQDKLTALDSLAQGDVIVNFGLVTTPDETQHLPGRWLVTFTGRYAGVDVQQLQVDDHVNDAELEVDSVSILEDTGRVETVREVLGVGIPTPIRAGARAICHWVHGIGYCIGPVEARDYGDYGLQGNI